MRHLAGAAGHGQGPRPSQISHGAWKDAEKDDRGDLAERGPRRFPRGFGGEGQKHDRGRDEAPRGELKGSVAPGEKPLHEVVGTDRQGRREHPYNADIQGKDTVPQHEDKHAAEFQTQGAPPHR